ncbi:uncharacterized protein LOC110976348 [Acanthaster planci]|uniref:Uncharacterized protein LOC110976348 n=1 Tax=Acanthaster planci TaxID=133434 RepID=A0A8B7XYW3_ACAPL|nr:uncharacterized protein LOC110976348 [Acanthaster planci]
MNRFILLLLLGAFVAAIFGDDPKPSESAAIAEDDSNKDGDIEAKGDFSVAWSGPQMWVCRGRLRRRRRYACHPPGRHHYKKRNDVQEESNPEFLDEAEANFFLRRHKRNHISEECCHEGCYWEEILEYC